jgi:type II secretory pathway component PulF
MLRAGIPLEGAVKQLASTLKRGALREELEQLQADLAKGTPLRDALPRRRLPELYQQLVQLGARGNDLPGMLTLLADYYQRRHLIWTKLQALMVYPAIVLLGSLGLSLVLAHFYNVYLDSSGLLFQDVYEGRALPAMAAAGGSSAMIFPALWLGLLSLLFLAALTVPVCRDWARWRLPGFRESSLSQFAATMRLLLAAGTGLPQALTLVGSLEPGTALGRELARWRDRIAAGAGRITEFASPSRLFPPMFLWLVGHGGEDLAGGFGRAAELYGERARHRVEMMLYAALPVAVLALGGLIVCQLLLGLRVCGVVTGLDMLGGDM